MAVGIDKDTACRYPFESSNHGRFMSIDVADLLAQETIDAFLSGCPGILAGCAPCQPFLAPTIPVGLAARAVIRSAGCLTSSPESLFFVARTASSWKTFLVSPTMAVPMFSGDFCRAWQARATTPGSESFSVRITVFRKSRND